MAKPSAFAELANSVPAAKTIAVTIAPAAARTPMGWAGDLHHRREILRTALANRQAASFVVGLGSPSAAMTAFLHPETP
ncbi:MAG TPA: hypothetical protein VMU34_06240 [Mycobacterium sp.]|nr:hypothetical protein [Mycobacterium sp.]